MAIESPVFTRRLSRKLHPTSAPSAADSSPDAAPAVYGWTAEQVAWAFVAWGLAIRAVRYLLRFPLWGDEAMLAENLLDRGYGELLLPLDYHQVSPFLFLWLELTATKLLGYHELSLRLFPTLCSLGSVLVFRQLAAQLLRGWPYALAVATFCVAYYPIRHGAEVKPYSADLLAAVTLLWLAVAWVRRPQTTWPLWTLAAISPVLLGISFTAVFVVASVAVLQLPVLWRQARPAAWAAFLVFCFMSAAAFGTFYFLHLEPLFEHVAGAMVNHHWSGAFPPWDDPAQLPLWLWNAHSGNMLAYPVGGPNSASAGTLVLCLTAAIYLYRRRSLTTLAVCLLPFAVGLAAACLRKYPYGDTARTMQYLAPGACLLFGLGLFVALQLARTAAEQARGLRIALACLAILGGGLMLKDFATPYKALEDQRVRDFARWFWHDQSQGAELVCAHKDLGLEESVLRIYVSPEHYCHRRIYAPQPTRDRWSAWDKIAADHPLRVVTQMNEGAPRDEQALADWIHHLESSRGLALAGQTRYHINRGSGDVYGRIVDVYEFVPAVQTSAATVSVVR